MKDQYGNSIISGEEKLLSRIKRWVVRWGGKRGIKIVSALKYYRCCGKFPCLSKPETFGEKILWIKLNYYNPLYTLCADKIAVKKYVTEKLESAGYQSGNSLFPKTYAIYENAEDIKIAELPVKFVLKPNHASGRVIICVDKTKLSERIIHNEASAWLKQNFYYEEGEWQYKDIIPQIICEELLEEDIIDYRIYCFDGKPSFVRTTRHNSQAKTGYSANFYDTNWNELGCILKGDIRDVFSRPKKWSEMLEIARILSRDFFFVRVDLYEAGNKIYFGELTFTSHNGIMNFQPQEWNTRLGNMIKLPIQ